MSAKSFRRGHEIGFNGEQWLYTNTAEPIDGEERPCKRCGRMPTAEGYDACLGYVEGVVSACCGHGVGPPYSVMEELPCAGLIAEKGGVERGTKGM